MVLPIERLAVIPIVLGIAVLFWDILLAGWIASQRQASRPFTTLTGLCGLLVAPAALVAMASMLEGTARTMTGIAWIWPLVTLGFTLQVGYALFARLLTPAVGLPLLLYDACVTTIAISDYLVSVTGNAPLWLQGAVASRDALSGFAIGRSALVSPLALLVPIIAPAYPARWRFSAAVRALLTLTATSVTTLLLMSWPQGVGAIRSYDAAIGVRMQERPANDFKIGLRVFPRIDRVPAERSVKADRRLADTLGVRALLIVLTDKGTRPAALDSLNRVLDTWRNDSNTVAIALELERSPGVPNSAQRMAAIERVLLRLKPDVLIPAWRSPLPPMLPAVDPDILWWQSLLNSSAQVITRVRPRTALGWAAARVDTRDSAVYDWAASSLSPVKVMGVIAFPSFAGLPALDARLRAFDRWHSLANTYNTTRTYWLMEAGGLPRAHGDASQTAAVMQALAWASRRPWISVAVLGDASDYDAAIGLRAADGRLRDVVGVVSRASRGMREATTGTR
ncbi:MAG: hypothetical protein ABI120_18485 [Gemmatimonadaceae bacterium]